MALRQLFARRHEVAHEPEAPRPSLSERWRRDAALVRAKALRIEKEAVHAVSRAWHATKPKMIQLEHRLEEAAILAYRAAKPRVIQMEHRFGAGLAKVANRMQAA